MHHRNLPLALVALVAFGCDGAPDDTADPGPDAAVDAAPQGDAVTWHAAIAPIVARRCATCHVEDGVAPFPLDGFEAVRTMAPVALASIEAGRMPPWMPDPDCREFEHARLMPADEVALFRRWVEAGTPAGDPETAAPIEVPEPVGFEPTDVARPIEAYVPDGGLDDDYRCFILDAQFPRDAFLTASRVVPDADALVHHVLVYAVGPDEVERLTAADAEEEGPGYTCFGGPFPSGTGDLSGNGAGLPTQIGSWVPGSVPQVFDEGLAVPIEAGSRIVMQVHYNLIGSMTEPDATTLEMRLTETPPDFVVATRPLLIRALDIPAGEPEARNVASFRNYTDRPVVIGGVAGHMHLLGTALRGTVERADGSEECLLDIPAWDFQWQQGYRIPREQWVEVQPGESITLECVYDNSAANQPFVGGEQVAPQDVSWGEGTLDEMCMLYMTLVRPYVPPSPAEACAPDAACLAACAAEGRPSMDCLVGCADDTECVICALRQTVGCGGAVCAAPFNAIRGAACFEQCFINTLMIGGDTAACFAEMCGAEYEALAGCLSGVVDSGSCDGAFADVCGITLSR